MTIQAVAQDFYQSLRIRRFQEQTIKNYSHRFGYLIKFIGEKPLDEITYNDLQGFLVTDYLQQLARGTYNHYISLVRLFFTFCHNSGLIPTNPAATIEFVREEQPIIEYFTLDELRKVLRTDHYYHYGPAKEFNLRDRVLVHLGALCCMRSSEARNLRWQDVNLEYGEIYVRRGKNLKDRIIPMPRPTLQLLKSEFKRKKPAKADFVLFGWHGNRMNHEIINAVIRRLCKDAGIEKKWPHFHMLRHTGATLYIRGKPGKRGMDIRVLKELLGHAHIGTTEKYTHVDKAFLASEMKRSLPSL